jgi:hypothetical protein
MDRLAIIEAESHRFAEVLAAADPAARCPTCPDWSASDLLWHLTNVHNFWAGVLSRHILDEADLVAVEAAKPDRPDEQAALLRLREEATAALLRQLAERAAGAVDHRYGRAVAGRCRLMDRTLRRGFGACGACERREAERGRQRAGGRPCAVGVDPRRFGLDFRRTRSARCSGCADVTRDSIELSAGRQPSSSPVIPRSIAARVRSGSTISPSSSRRATSKARSRSCGVAAVSVAIRIAPCARDSRC